MKRLLANHKAMLGLAIMAVFMFAALFGPLFVADPQAFVGQPLQPPSAAHWFGTTGQGQDVFAQTIVGTRSSLLIGILVGFSVVAIGSFVGTAAGYFGGRVDDALSTMINIFLIMPGLPLMVVMAAYLPQGPASIALVLIVTGWSWSARVLRSQAMAIRQKDFIAAAVVAGESHLRIILVEILPNMISLLASACIGATIYAIAAQVGLEFLGLGEVSSVTWGTNLYWATNDASLLTGSWWTFVPTGLCVAVVGFALALINTAIDEIGNPRLRSDRAFLKAIGKRSVSPDDPTPVVRMPKGGPTP